MVAFSQLIGFPSRLTLSPGNTRWPFSAALPLISTRPSLMKLSASRLEAKCAKHLLILVPCRLAEESSLLVSPSSPASNCALSTVDSWPREPIVQSKQLSEPSEYELPRNVALLVRPIVSESALEPNACSFRIPPGGPTTEPTTSRDCLDTKFLDLPGRGLEFAAVIKPHALFTLSVPAILLNPRPKGCKCRNPVENPSSSKQCAKKRAKTAVRLILRKPSNPMSQFSTEGPMSGAKNT
mmetsp:Transcript_44700/g.69965  ORF Transcript_44700/g.69965 Transcript_44700/m.69965 type:complete len:239 (-) Transcript_44700:3-719(-)